MSYWVTRNDAYSGATRREAWRIEFESKSSPCAGQRFKQP